MSVIPIGVCAYCGQVGRLNDERFDTQEEADEYATEHCSCAAAQSEQRMNERIANAKEHARDIFGEGATEYGFRPVADNRIFSLLDQLIELVVRQQVNRASLIIRGECRATVSMKSKGEIEIGRSETRAYKYAE